MNQESPKNPLPPCPLTPNCVRTSEEFEADTEKVFEALSNIFEQQAHSFEVIDSQRFELHAVYRIPVFGFKDDVDVILERSDDKTVVFVRSASRVGAYDLGVNDRRVKRILQELGSEIQQ